MTAAYLEAIQKQFNYAARIEERRSDLFQVVAPLYHEDGDMMNIFLHPLSDGRVRICDYGKSLMRLSYTFELDSERKNEILGNIVTSNMATLDDGNIYIDTDVTRLYNAIMQFSQVVAKVTNLDILSKAVVTNLFYDYLHEYVENNLQDFRPQKNFHPIESYSELVVDYCFDTKNKPIYLFGVKDDNKANKATITCLQSQKKGLNFRSIIVYDDFDKLGKFSRNQLIDVSDKQFSTFDSFKDNANDYFRRESAS